jgi:hypothetical protein
VNDANPDRAGARRALRELVVRLLATAEDDVVMITELQCIEPGCPPIETVIAVLGTGPRHQMKIHRPILEITEADLIAAIADPHRH